MQGRLGARASEARSCSTTGVRRHPVAWLLWPYVAALATVAVLAWSNALPVHVVDPWDKVIHLVGVGILAALLDLWWRGRSLGPIPWAIALVVGLFALDETLQALSPWRTFDLVDLAANTVGPVACVALVRLGLRHRTMRRA